MKIENGKYYRTRSGNKVGPMNVPPEGSTWAPMIAADDGQDGWYSDGKYTLAGRHKEDIIAEWSEPMDMTAITTPFGLLDRETQEALKAHGGPYKFAAPENNWKWIPIDGKPLWSPMNVYCVEGKPAPPKPREWWCVGAHMRSTKASAQAFIDELNAKHPEMDFGPIIHVIEAPEGTTE